MFNSFFSLKCVIYMLRISFGSFQISRNQEFIGGFSLRARIWRKQTWNSRWWNSFDSLKEFNCNGTWNWDRNQVIDCYSLLTYCYLKCNHCLNPWPLRFMLKTEPKKPFAQVKGVMNETNRNGTELTKNLWQYLKQKKATPYSHKFPTEINTFKSYFVSMTMWNKKKFTPH